MNPLLKTYWIEFGEALNTHCGVTAYSLDDAIALLQKSAFNKQIIPPVIRYTESIRVSDLDQNHVVPNMGPISERGVWYPNYFPL